MTTAPHRRSAPSVRRPPTTRDDWASVTQLVPTGSQREQVSVASVQGTLALDLEHVPHLPHTPDLLVLPVDGSPEPGDLREVQEWAARFAQATVETLGGDRPLSQLLRWTSPRVYAELDRRLRVLGRATPGPRSRRVRPQVRSVHVCRPAAGVAEVSVHVRHGARSRALAARLEHRGGRWLCVALQLG